MQKYYDVVKQISIEFSEEPCRVDAKTLHNTLMCLPEGLYLELYGLMSNVIFNGTEAGVDNAE